MRRHPPLGRGPSQLFRDMRQIGSMHIGIHRSCLEAHRGDREIFENDPRISMLLKHLINRPIDLLAHVPPKALPAGAAGGRELLHPLFLEAGPQLGLATAFLSIALVALGEFAMKGSVLLSRRGREKVGDPHINAHARGSWLRLKRNVLIEREGKPPDPLALVQSG